MPRARRPNTLRRARAIVVLTLVLASASAVAYVRSRSPDGQFTLLWAAPAITMTLRTAGPQVVPASDFAGAAQRAAATWSAPDLGSSVAFTIGESVSAPAGTHFDHINTISFRTDSWTPPMYPDFALALTTVWSQAGTIVDADTEINAADPRFKWGILPDDPTLAATSPEVDLQNALTHELGHVIGLAHPCFLGSPPVPAPIDDRGDAVLSCSDPALPASVRTATMFPSSEPGSIAERDLSADEVQALHDLYPARPIPRAALGSRDGGCRVGPSRDAGDGGIALLVAAIALARRRRRA
jgi:MYXO-CTERM domain-containing protein